MPSVAHPVHLLRRIAERQRVCERIGCHQGTGGIMKRVC
jgi:hypothetical protein